MTMEARDERPSSRPTPAEVCAFGREFDVARKKIAQIRKEAAPPEEVDDNIAF